MADLDLGPSVPARQLETGELRMVFRERAAPGVLGAPIPPSAISLLTFTLYDEGSGAVINARADIALITDGVVSTELTRLTCTYAIEATTGAWTLGLVLDPDDMPIRDERLTHEAHVASFVCIHTGGTFRPRVMIDVENLGRTPTPEG